MHKIVQRKPNKYRRSKRLAKYDAIQAELFGDIENRSAARLKSLYKQTECAQNSLDKVLLYMPIIARYCKRHSLTEAPKSLLVELMNCADIPRRLGVKNTDLPPATITEGNPPRAHFVRGGSPGLGKRR